MGSLVIIIIIIFYFLSGCLPTEIYRSRNKGKMVSVS